MSTTDTYLAIFLGSKTSPRRAAWDALSETERREKEREGIAAWKAWVEKNKAALVTMGGPLGKTKKVTQRGIEDRATTSAPLRWCARTLRKQPPRCLKNTRTLSSSRVMPSKSCRCCRFLEVSATRALHALGGRIHGGTLKK